MEGLQELITKIVQDLDVSHLNKRVTDYKDFQSNYVILKPKVEVKVELTCGKLLIIDVSDYFKGVVE